MTGKIILIIVAAVTLAVVLTSLLTSGRMRKKVSYMLDALEDKELNFRFDEKRFIGRKFNKTLNRLRSIFDKERREIMEQEQYYGLMLDHVRTGIVVTEPDGRVNYYNNTALNLLGIATFSNIRQLKKYGFGGVAILGDIWNRFDEHDTIDYNEVIQEFRILKKLAE